MPFWNIKFESSGTVEWDVEADTLDEAETIAEQELEDEMRSHANDYNSYSSTLVDEDGKPLGKEVFVGHESGLTDQQVNAITYAWIDCKATGEMSGNFDIDLDGLSEAASATAEELEEAFPFLKQEITDENDR
tara:strand:- start:49 stop:447 length:399 start_codon:yes stop_codon:yes gene_type:complete